MKLMFQGEILKPKDIHILYERGFTVPEKSDIFRVATTRPTADLKPMRIPQEAMLQEALFGRYLTASRSQQTRHA